jgi:UDP-N-acetylglucosamine:LPS N-acetylglucosamine transferase
MMKTAKPTILILTTHTGGGHLNLAQSLRGLLEEHYEVAIANPQSTMVGDSYTFVIRHFLPFLTWQYSVTDYKFAAFWLHRVLTPFSQRRFLNMIEHFQPQLIITTHAMLSYATARANERRQKRVPLVFQLTDLAELHMTWFTEKKADAYLAPSREIFEQAQKQGISSKRLHITGRPIRRQFLEVAQDVSSETLTALDFDPTVFTIFLQGGAKGSAGTDRTIEILLSMEIPVQIMLAVGDNQRMAARYAGSKQVRTLPFTERIAPYMAAADVIAGKAGASFITEAFMLEKPFLATAFIPGQETPNLQFIERHNLGWVCLDASTQQELFTGIATNPALIAQKMADIRAYKTWNKRANQNICPLIERLLPFEKLGHGQESV